MLQNTYNIITTFEDTRGTTIIVDVFNIVQKVPDTGIHLKVDEEQGRVAQGSKRQVSGEPPSQGEKCQNA